MRTQPPRTPEITRTTNLRLKFSLSSLLLAGAFSFAGLFATNDAQALSGTLSAAGTTTTPRDSSGASGGATLIRTAASSTSSSESTPSQVTGPSESSSSGSPSTARTSGGTRRRAQTEEGGHRRNGTSTAARNSRRGDKAVADSKDHKEVAPVPTAPDTVHFSLSSGYETRYIYHGLDIIGFNSKLYLLGGAGNRTIVDTNDSSAIFYENADVAFKGAHLGIGYVRAESPTYPFFQKSGLNLNDALPGVNHKRFYQEVDANADYTATIIGGILDGTVGYNSYFFAYRDYKGSSYQGELFGRLAYKQLKYVVPSFTFYRYVSKYNENSAAGNLNGSYAEFRIDGSVPVFENAMINVTVAPYVAAGYNISYLKYGNNDVGGWNDVEMGIKLPTRIAKHFVVTPYGNYGLDVSDSSNTPINNFTGRGYGERTHFWGGVTVAYTF